MATGPFAAPVEKGRDRSTGPVFADEVGDVDVARVLSLPASMGAGDHKTCAVLAGASHPLLTSLLMLQ
jgi:hypothetical protein